MQANYCFPQKIIRNYLITVLPAAALAFALYLLCLCNIWAIWWKLHSMMQSKSKAAFSSGSNEGGGGGGGVFVFSGLIQGKQGKPFTTDLQSVVSSSSTITPTNWPQLIIFSENKGKGIHLTISDINWARIYITYTNLILWCFSTYSKVFCLNMQWIQWNHHNYSYCAYLLLLEMIRWLVNKHLISMLRNKK